MTPVHINGNSYGYKELGEYLCTIYPSFLKVATYSRLAVCIPHKRRTHQVQHYNGQQQLQWSHAALLPNQTQRTV